MGSKHYESELAYLREMGREFALVHPTTAGLLAEKGSDPDVEHRPVGDVPITPVAHTGVARLGARVLVAGMQVPPNYGADYARRFASAFEQAARAEGAALVPFLLKGVADRADALDWFQADRIHPNVRAQPVMLDNVWPELAKQLGTR